MTDKPNKAPDSELDQRAKQLAKELLDALQNPDPVREAERAAYEEQKAKDDEASINAFHARRKAAKAGKAAKEVTGKKIAGLIATRPEQPTMSATRGSLDPKAIEVHRKWVLDGRKGVGALDVVGVDATNARLDGLVLTGARLERVTLVGANLTYTSLDESELLGCDFKTARISSARFTGSTLADCSFESAQGGQTDYVGAKITSCSFVSAALDGSWWKQATVDRSQFMAARFSNAQFDGARFTACDFREASFKPLTPLPLPSMKGATFEQCDFRDVELSGADLSGATFRACKFGDAHGRPASADHIVVLDGDFSEAGDGSDLGGAKDLIAQLAR